MKAIKTMAQPSVRNIQRTAKLRVAVYARVSTDYAEQMTSYDNQIEVYTKKVMSNPEWELVGIYADPAISGTTGDRPEFKRMLRDADRQKFDMILCKSISRFARNTLLTIETIRHLQSIGIAVEFEKEHINTGESYAEMILTIMAAFAQEESRNTSERVKKGLHFQHLNGIANWVPLYGFKKEGDKAYLVDEEKAAVIRRIFAEAEKGGTGKIISDGLNDDNIPAPQGGTWSEIKISRILANEKYVGDVLTNKIITTDHLSHKRVKNNGNVEQILIPNHHAPIVEREQYDRVQLIRQMKHDHTYPFFNRLICPHCGNELKFEANVLGKDKSAWVCRDDLFYMRSSLLPNAVLEAYKRLDVSNVNDEVTKKIKTENPEFEKVDYWWLDELADLITFGKHENDDDQTLTVNWICGEKTTVPTGNGLMESLSRKVQKRENRANGANRANAAKGAKETKTRNGTSNVTKFVGTQVKKMASQNDDLSTAGD